jgi:hypothetical protein
VSSQASPASGTPSPSASPPERGNVVVVGERTVVEVVDEVVLVVGGRVVVDVLVDDGRVVVVVVGGRFVDVLVVVGRVVVVDVVGGRVVDVVVLLVVDVVDTGTVPRHDTEPTCCPMRVLTTLPNTRSMLERPPPRRWQ